MRFLAAAAAAAALHVAGTDAQVPSAARRVGLLQLSGGQANTNWGDLLSKLLAAAQSGSADIERAAINYVCPATACPQANCPPFHADRLAQSCLLGPAAPTTGNTAGSFLDFDLQARAGADSEVARSLGFDAIRRAVVALLGGQASALAGTGAQAFSLTAPVQFGAVTLSPTAPQGVCTPGLPAVCSGRGDCQLTCGGPTCVYQCVCRDGYTGTQCATPPVTSGGTCSPTPTAVVCSSQHEAGVAYTATPLQTVAAASAAICQTQCQATTGCGAWVWGQTPGSCAMLPQFGSGRVQVPGAVSGPRSCTETGCGTHGTCTLSGTYTCVCADGWSSPAVGQRCSTPPQFLSTLPPTGAQAGDDDDGGGGFRWWWLLIALAMCCFLFGAMLYLHGRCPCGKRRRRSSASPKRDARSTSGRSDVGSERGLAPQPTPNPAPPFLQPSRSSLRVQSRSPADHHTAPRPYSGAVKHTSAPPPPSALPPTKGYNPPPPRSEQPSPPPPRPASPWWPNGDAGSPPPRAPDEPYDSGYAEGYERGVQEREARAYDAGYGAGSSFQVTPAGPRPESYAYQSSPRARMMSDGRAMNSPGGGMVTPPSGEPIIGGKYFEG